MCKLKINLDSYEEFFINGAGRQLISNIIQNGDHDEVECIAEWEKCDSKVLAEIATKFMYEDENEKVTRKNLELLEDVAENPRVSSKTLGELLKFAIGLMNIYGVCCNELLEEIAKSKKLNEAVATELYKVAKKYDIADVITELAENKKTPDDVLFDIIEHGLTGFRTCSGATNQIVERYKKLKEKLNTDK